MRKQLFDALLMGRNIFISVLTANKGTSTVYDHLYMCKRREKCDLPLQANYYSGCHSNTDDRQMSACFALRKIQLYTDRILQNKLCLLLALVTLHTATLLFFGLTPELVFFPFKITA